MIIKNKKRTRKFISLDEHDGFQHTTTTGHFVSTRLVEGLLTYMYKRTVYSNDGTDSHK